MEVKSVSGIAVGRDCGVCWNLVAEEPDSKEKGKGKGEIPCAMVGGMSSISPGSCRVCKGKKQRQGQRIIPTMDVDLVGESADAVNTRGFKVLLY